MANQPKTPMHGVRVDDDLWDAALATTAKRGETVSAVIRRALRSYVGLERHLCLHCIACGEQHVAEYSHNSSNGGHDLYAVLCEHTGRTVYYTLAALEWRARVEPGPNKADR